MKTLSSVLTIIILAFATAAFAEPPCPPDMTGSPCREDLKLIAPGNVIEKKSVKHIKIMHYSETNAPSALSALNAALEKAERWLTTQKPENIISHAQAISCSRPGHCTASATVMYWTEEK